MAGRRAERLPASLTTRPTRPDPSTPRGTDRGGPRSPFALATAPVVVGSAAGDTNRRSSEARGDDPGEARLRTVRPRGQNPRAPGPAHAPGAEEGNRPDRPPGKEFAPGPELRRGVAHARPEIPGSGRGIAGNSPATVPPSTSRPRKEVTGRFPSSLAPPAPSAAMRRWYSTASSDPVGYWAPIPRAACRASGPLAAGAGRPVTGTAPRACRRGVAVPARTVRSGRRRDTGTSGPMWRSVGPRRGAPSRSRDPGP